MSEVESSLQSTGMSTDLSSARLKPLFTLQLEISALLKVGIKGAGLVIGVVGGGAFEGRLRGRVLGGGSDWQREQPDGSRHLDCRVILETSNKEMIAMTYRGVLAGPGEVLSHLAAGAPVTADEYYLRIEPKFETGASEFAWLNRILTVGVGMRRPTGPVYNIYEVM